MRRALVLCVSLAAAAAGANAPGGVSPSPAECAALGAPQAPMFPAGERLEYDLDAMGAEAGKLVVRVLPTKNGAVPVEVTANTNTLFSKMRKVKATATSYLDPKTLRPHRYVEESSENDVHRTADVSFRRGARQVNLDYTIRGRRGTRTFRGAHEALDPAAAIFLLRQLPMREGARVCFDSYGVRNMWRVNGRIVGKERVSLGVGEFEAWHFAGEAVRADNAKSRREVHLWVSADEKRLPLAAVGVIDLGAVRATLTSYTRPDGSKRAQGKESLKW